MTLAITIESSDRLTAAQHTLADEHMQLMREVARRASPVLALLDARVWPHAELGTLTNFLRTAVLGHVSDEETFLYPHDTSAPPFTELSADHVRLQTMTAQLERACSQPCPPAQLRALVDELLTILHRHLTAEQQALAALPDAGTDIPSAGDVAAGRKPWLPDDKPVFIRLDPLPDEQAIRLCIERLLRLLPGQTAELHAHDDHRLRAICHWLHDFDAARFAIDHPASGPDHLLRVTCRRATGPTGIGYPG
jgi:hypothetical protein